MTILNPLREMFWAQRSQARHRGIVWDLAFWEWLQIWEDSGHLHERGKKKGQWVMARKGDTGPYAAYNVQIVRCEINNRDAAKTRFKSSASF